MLEQATPETAADIMNVHEDGVAVVTTLGELVSAVQDVTSDARETEVVLAHLLRRVRFIEGESLTGLAA